MINVVGAPNRREIYIADDHPLIVRSFCDVFLSLDSSAHVIGFTDFAKLVSALSHGAVPDIVLIDFDICFASLSCELFMAFSF